MCEFAFSNSKARNVEKEKEKEIGKFNGNGGWGGERIKILYEPVTVPISRA